MLVGVRCTAITVWDGKNWKAIFLVFFDSEEETSQMITEDELGKKT